MRGHAVLFHPLNSPGTDTPAGKPGILKRNVTSTLSAALDDPAKTRSKNTSFFTYPPLAAMRISPERAGMSMLSFVASVH